MKRILLSVTLLFTVCALATAQHKMKFGVTVQAGNYRQARQGNQANDYLNSSYRQSGGILAGLGVYAERALCRHVALYSGLNFSQSTFTDQFTNVYPDQEKRQSGSGTYAQTGQFTVRQVALPVQLQLRAGAKHSISFSVGVAPSFTVTKLRADPNSRYSFNPSDIAYCGVGSYGGYYMEDPSRFQVLVTTGLHYRPDTYNTIGLEWWVAPKTKKYTEPLYYGYGYYQDSYGHYQMRSLQVSLRHSW